MNRLALLFSCALVACSLDLPGSGPSLTDDDADPIYESDPSAVTPGAPSAAKPATTSAGAAASSPSAAQAATDGGVVITVGDASTTTTVTTPPLPSSDAGGSNKPSAPAAPIDSTFALTSSAFDDGARLPTAFTCKAADQSPPLAWANPPANTKSFSLVLTSKSAAKPNASPTVEWVVWQIPATRSSLPQGVAAGEQPSNVSGARQDSVSDDDDTGTGGYAGAGGFTGFGGTVGVGVGAGASFGGNWGGTIAGAGVTSSLPGSSGAAFYPSSSGTQPRYHGPCGASEVTYEFTLFALDASATGQWGSFVSIDTVTQWIKTRSNVLGQASVSATFP